MRALKFIVNKRCGKKMTFLILNEPLSDGKILIISLLSDLDTKTSTFKIKLIYVLVMNFWYDGRIKMVSDCSMNALYH